MLKSESEKDWVTRCIKCRKDVILHSFLSAFWCWVEVSFSWYWFFLRFFTDETERICEHQFQPLMRVFINFLCRAEPVNMDSSTLLRCIFFHFKWTFKYFILSSNGLAQSSWGCIGIVWLLNQHMLKVCFIFFITMFLAIKEFIMGHTFATFLLTTLYQTWPYGMVFRIWGV